MPAETTMARSGRTAYVPDDEVLPGVRWGLPERVPSVAYWAAMVGNAEEETDGYVGREATLQSELGFCLLGGYGITAEMNHAAHALLSDAGLDATATAASPRCCRRPAGGWARTGFSASGVVRG